MSEAKTILIVDDDQDFSQSVRDLLEAHDYQVVAAFDGESGLEKAKEVKPDLILLDVMMAHDTEGFEVSRKIPRVPELRDTPVLLVTGIRREKNLAFSFEPDATWLPVERVLEKPVPPEKLLGEITRIFAD
jgi:twitching motility two-component system response regulator PilH